MTNESAAAAPRRKTPKRLLMAALPLALIAAGLWVWLDSGRFEATDNAAFQQARISVASNLSGRLTRVDIEDSQTVAAGQELFQVDPEPYRLALARAETALAQARLQVDQMRASYRAALAQQKSAEDSAAYYETELKRQQAVTGRGVGTQSALDEARHNANAGREAATAATQQAEAALAALGGDAEIATDDHPQVRAAIVARDQAAYDLGLTTVKAPADGVVYKADNFKTGGFVTAGTALFSLVETANPWVTANFKETQIGAMQPGDKATVEFDALPGRKLEAVVASIGAGTGAEFSVLPAQNATGNWVKVTQRVPVKLRFAPDADLSGLRTGLSANVTVDTRAQTKLDSLLGDLDRSK